MYIYILDTTLSSLCFALYSPFENKPTMIPQNSRHVCHTTWSLPPRMSMFATMPLPYQPDSWWQTLPPPQKKTQILSAVHVLQMDHLHSPTSIKNQEQNLKDKTIQTQHFPRYSTKDMISAMTRAAAVNCSWYFLEYCWKHLQTFRRMFSGSHVWKDVFDHWVHKSRSMSLTCLDITLSSTQINNSTLFDFYLIVCPIVLCLIIYVFKVCINECIYASM